MSESNKENKILIRFNPIVIDFVWFTWIKFEQFLLKNLVIIFFWGIFCFRAWTHRISTILNSWFCVLYVRFIIRKNSRHLWRIVSSFNCNWISKFKILSSNSYNWTIISRPARWIIATTSSRPIYYRFSRILPTFLCITIKLFYPQTQYIHVVGCRSPLLLLVITEKVSQHLKFRQCESPSN